MVCRLNTSLILISVITRDRCMNTLFTTFTKQLFRYGISVAVLDKDGYYSKEYLSNLDTKNLSKQTTIFNDRGINSKLQESISLRVKKCCIKSEADSIVLYIQEQQILKRFDLIPLSVMIQNDEKKYCLIFVQNYPDIDESLDFDFLSNFFQLTKAELLLAKSISVGISPREYANDKGITVNTARWTLANLFEKFGVNSQERLRRLISVFYK